MLNLISWYLITFVAGWLVFPLAYRLLAKLPDRGMAFLRPLGLLAWGFVFWMLASLGIFQNSTGNVLFALVLVAGLSAWVGRGHWAEMRAWLRARMGMVVLIEIIFLAAMVYMAVMRSASPEIVGTEKPMELAFINAILRSPGMPPHDPWLAGYAISYYYFGYLMVAMLAKVSGVAGGVAFNLAVALWFAMTAVAAYGVLYNLLVAARPSKTETEPASARSRFRLPGANGWALLAPLFILILSNLGGLFEVLHSSGAFWQRGENGQLTSSFWQSLKIEEWDQPPSEPFRLDITRSGWWWWRSSRVLQDFRMNGQPVEVIDEFPNFSYYLADLHPHVLSVPFVLLVLGLIFNFYLKNRPRGDDALDGGQILSLKNWVRTPDFWASAVIVGGLGFLNVWDFPIYVVVFGMVYTLAHYQRSGWNIGALLGKFFSFVLVLAVAGALLYAPYYLGFSSQAGPPYFYLSLAFFTPGVNFWIMFATLLIPLFAWLLWMTGQTRIFGKENRRSLWHGLTFGAVLVFGLWLLSYLIGLILVLLLNSNPYFSVFGQSVGSWFYGQQGSTDGFGILGESFLRRLAQPGTWLTLLGLLALVWGLLNAFRRVRSDKPEGKTEGALIQGDQAGASSMFALILVLAGAGLTLVPEFFFLKDDFGARMNTIFKFYYQSWVMWGIAAAFGTVVLWKNLRPAWKIVYLPVSLVLILVGLIYPFKGISDRVATLDNAARQGSTNETVTLDGTAYMRIYNPEEWQAIQYLQAMPDGVILEAIGGQYSQYARVATLTGMPNVLGWPGHEGQWRGTRVNFMPRVDEVKLVYEAPDWDTAKTILDQYQVRYIYIGSLERTTYNVFDRKFAGKASPIFQNDSVIIYEYLP